MSRRALRTAATAVLAAGLLTGCASVTDSLVGLRPAPTERMDVAAIDVGGAQLVAAKGLQNAEAALQAQGATAAAERKAALTGPALLMAEAAVATKTTEKPAVTNPLSMASQARVVAVSKGKGWPRAILATHFDKEVGQQFLHVLTSASASSPYVVRASVPMLPGTSLPSLGTLEEGAPLVPSKDGTGAVLSPDEALAAYAAALAQPGGKQNPAVTSQDDFGRALWEAGKLATTNLKKLGTYSQVHAVVPDQALAWRLPDGGRVVFGLLQRTDTSKAGAGAKELTITDPEIAAISGKKSAKSSIAIVSLEEVVMIVPAQGKATLIGVQEQVKAVQVN